MGGSTWNGPIPKTCAQCAAVPSRSSTTKPSWNSRYSPSGHGCSNRRCGIVFIDASRYCRPNQDLLHHGRNEVSAKIVDRAMNQPAMAREGDRLLSVEMPGVEADRSVEPDGMVQAEPGERRGPVAVRVGAERHVEEEVVARVREQRAMQERVVPDVARQTHPVRARPRG